MKTSMMTMVGMVSAALLASVSVAWAGEIFGTISEGGSSLHGVGLRLRCGDQTVNATADEYGAYRISVPTTGDCELSTDYTGDASLQVHVSSSPVRYDVPVRSRNGTKALGRE